MKGGIQMQTSPSAGRYLGQLSNKIRRRMDTFAAYSRGNPGVAPRSRGDFRIVGCAALAQLGGATPSRHRDAA